MQRPPQVDLFLDRQRPQWLKASPAATPKALADVGRKESIPVPDSTPIETEEHRAQRNRDAVWRQNPQCAAKVERPEERSATRLHFQKNPGDQKSAENEEGIDSHPEQRNTERMMDKHTQERD